MANTIAKMELQYEPTKGTRAWLCKFVDHPIEVWLPYSTITAWQPATKQMNVQAWILKQKGIKYKV